MIKFVFSALWISAVSVGAVYYSFQQARSKANEEPPPAYFGGLDYVKTDVISVPVFDGGAVHGYFLTRLVYTVKPDMLKKMTLPAEPVIVDTVYTYLYANPQIDFTSRDRLDLDAFRAAVREGINAKVGKELVHEILIEQVDYLTKADIRDNTIRRRAEEATLAGQAAADAAAEAAAPDAGH